MQIRIPSSAPRKQPLCYAKLLRRVRSVARSGFDFEGDFVRPGSLIDELLLRTSVDYPGEPCLLECAGVSRSGHGHDRSELLYILWQYHFGGCKPCQPQVDKMTREWLELGRVTSASWDWAADLAPIARRAMGERRCDLAGVAREILAFVNLKLTSVPEAQRAGVAAIAHDALAAELIAHVPFGSRDTFAVPLLPQV